MILRAGNSVQGKYGALDMVLRAGNSVQREIWNTLYITPYNNRLAKYLHTAILSSADALFNLKLRVSAYTDKFVEPLQK